MRLSEGARSVRGAEGGGPVTKKSPPKTQVARIVECADGSRIIVTRFNFPVEDQTVCLEIHRRDLEDAYRFTISALLLTEDEFKELGAAVKEIADMKRET